jgi:UDP-N-acetylmuramate--alanine ligase
MGIQVFEGHRAENIAGADLIIQSSAIAQSNSEIVAALKKGIPVYKRSEYLGRLLQGKTGIAVAGTHGKTTTSSMIAWMLTELGKDPSFIVGGLIKGLETNAHAGKGAEFVIEADEYDRMFLGLNPTIAIVTHLEHDHPDNYPTMAEYTQAFQEFVGNIKPHGIFLACSDHPAVVELLDSIPAYVQGLLYGINPDAHYRAVNLSVVDGDFHFDLEKNWNDKNVQLATDVHLSIPGQHNVQNATAALAVADLLGLDVASAAQTLATFQGSGRRFEVVGEIGGITLVDDYAHHPTEISATLAAARSRYPQHRIWAVWQPHTYSRTRLLADQFAESFNQADRVIVTEIYASREKKEEYSSARVAEMIKGSSVVFMDTLEHTTDHLLAHLRPGDLVVVLSAGDADQINQQLLVKLAERTN